jgi:hypothetical protein
LNCRYKVTPSGIPNEGIMFVDHQSKRRSGHMSHALVEYAQGCILSFYSNCSAVIEHGHTGYGWIEYKRTTDEGKTWSDPVVLDYSYNSLLDGLFNISCEKAVFTDNGVIVLFCLRNKKITRWEPYLEPVVLRSFDEGATWSEPILFSDQRGRIMDAFYKDGVIYALEFCNDAEIKWTGNLPEHVYRMYVSTDDGLHFEERSILPFDTYGRHYGALEWLPDGGLIAYIYNEYDEFNLDCCISYDNGFTWGKPFNSFCAKRIRNPQVCSLNGLYFLHGRSGCNDPSLPFNFVLYTSEDGVKWDDGVYLCVTQPGGWGNAGYYSNNCVTGRFGGARRILIQASDPYFEGCVNIKHWWIDC